MAPNESVRRGEPTGAIVDLAAKKVGRAKRFKPLRPQRTDAGPGPMAALHVLVDSGSGYATGDGKDLLYTPEGEKLLERGF